MLEEVIEQTEPFSRPRSHVGFKHFCLLFNFSNIKFFLVQRITQKDIEERDRMEVFLNK